MSVADGTPSTWGQTAPTTCPRRPDLATPPVAHIAPLSSRVMRWLGLIVALGIAACTPRVAPEPAPATPPPATSPSATSPATSPTPPLVAEAVAPAPRTPYAPDPAGFGSPCDDDAGCGWDDGCVPTRCVGAAHAATSPTECDESAPPPGACLCHAGRCALRPTHAPPPSEPGCKASLCGLDEAAGRCLVGERLEANRRRRDQGPACLCDAASDRCEFRWVEPVPCQSDAECWLSDQAPRHPIARPKRLRGQKFRPCRDGELAPACMDGACTLRAYKC